MTASAGNL